MQDLKITLVQANQIWESKEANFENYEQLLNTTETDLILLPEMFQTGFSMNTEKLGESMEGKSISWLKKLASNKGAAIYTSLIIEEEGNFYNRGVFVTPGGEVTTYDKRKTFGLAGEDTFFHSGTKETIVTYKGWNIQLQICYDLRFPEIVRNRMLPNERPAYDVILYVANWPEKRAAHWKALLKARAIENQCFVAGVNRVGKDEKGLSYSGDSGLYNALGDAFLLIPGKESVETFVMKKDDLNDIRELLPFLKDA